MAKSSETNSITVKMKFEKETKGAVRYQEVDGNGDPVEISNGAVLGSLYIRKSGINGVPKALSVVLTPE